MSDLIQTTTHEADGLARRIERFKNKPNFEGLLRVLLRRTQAIENVLWDIYIGIWLDNAVGVQLDNLGDVVGEPRLGRGDDVYRTYIRARIVINRSNGKLADTFKVLRLVLEDTANIVYTPEYPAGYRIDIGGTALALADAAALLNAVRAAGVQLTLVLASDLEHALIWDSAVAAHMWDAGEWSDSI